MKQREDLPLRSLVSDILSGFASSENTSDGVAQVRMNNVTTEGGWDWSSIRRIPASSDQIRKYQLRNGDVLFNSTNSPSLVGKTAVFRERDEPFVFSNHFLRIRVNPDFLDSSFLA